MSKSTYKLNEFLASPNEYYELDFCPNASNNNYKITDSDCQRLANVLKNNTTVTTLYLDSNKIGDSGAAAIGQALAINTALRYLYLNQNQIGDSAVAALKQAGSRLGGRLQLENQGQPGTAEEIAAKKADYDMFMTVFNNDIDKVKEWISQGYDFNSVDAKGKNIIWHAAFSGKGELVTLLAESKVDIEFNKPDNTGASPSQAGSVLCMKIKAKASIKLAEIAEKAGNDVAALKNYTDAINADKEQSEIYEKMGQLFVKQGEYKKAILCYEVVNDSYEVKSCFKKWLKIEPKNPEIMMMKGDHLASIGGFDKAKICYNHAASLYKNDQVKKDEALAKVVDILKNKTNLVEHFENMIADHDYYNFDMVDDAFVSLMGEI